MSLPPYLYIEFAAIVNHSTSCAHLLLLGPTRVTSDAVVIPKVSQQQRWPRNVSLEICLAPSEAAHARGASDHGDGFSSSAQSNNGISNCDSGATTSSSIRNTTWAASVVVPGLTECNDNHLHAFLEFGGHGDVLHLAFPSCLWPTAAQGGNKNSDDADARGSSSTFERIPETGMPGIVVALQPWLVPKSTSTSPGNSPGTNHGSSSDSSRSSDGSSSKSERSNSNQSDVWSRGIASPPIIVALAPQRRFQSREPLPTTTPGGSKLGSSSSSSSSSIVTDYYDSNINSNGGVSSSSMNHEHLGLYGPAELTASALAHDRNLLAEQTLPVQNL